MTYRFLQWYIPDRMIPGLRRWAEQGIKPGDFLCAVLANDFMEICGRADDENMRNLPAYAAYLYNEMPRACWGSLEKMKAWQETFKTESKNNG